MTVNIACRIAILSLLLTLPGRALPVVKIAIVQYEIRDLHKVGDDAMRLESFIREAAAEGAELVVCPETTFYRYEPWEQHGVTMLDLARHYDGLKNKFTALADDLDISLVIGLREPSGDKEKPVFNTALFIGPDGTILGKQHKLVPSNDEKAWTKAGTGNSVFETPQGRVGMMICKSAKTDWWAGYGKEDELDLFILIAGDKDATSFERFPSICIKSNCYGLIANQICGPESEKKARKGNSSWAYPDGSVTVLGGDEQVFYLDLPLPIEKSFAPRPGQIITDPENPSWLVYNMDANGDGRLDPYFMCGPGDPEGFLYRGKRNPDGTRDGDQYAMIRKVGENGGNCIYLMAVRTHGGDAWKDAERDPGNYPDKAHNPWVGQNPAYGLNQELLDQWELWFTEMDRHGITIYLFIYDDAIRVGERLGWPLDSKGNLHPGEKQFIREIVDRFEHHNNLIWCIMEEGQEIGKDWRLHVSKIAAEIRDADDYGHVIATHQLGGNVFHHANDSNINQFALQGNPEAGNSPDSVHNWLADAWRIAGGRYNLNMAEHRAHEMLSRMGDREGIRKHNWAIAMAGSYIMVLGMEIIHTPLEQLQDCRRLQQFFESTDVNTMSPHDELKFAGTEFVLAWPGKSYIAYSSRHSEKLGIRDMTSGIFDLAWYDCVTGKTSRKNNITVSSGHQFWERPPGFGEEVALYLSRVSDKPGPVKNPASGYPSRGSETRDSGISGRGNTPPTAQDQLITTRQDTPVYIQLSYSDPDGGPGPYETVILVPPSHGSLSGAGNDQTYTPEKGYKGTDRFEWKVSDGAEDSDTVNVIISIEQ